MYFEADIMGTNLPGRCPSPKYPSSSHNQDEKHIFSDSETNKMLAFGFGMIFLWLGVLVGIGFAIKKLDEISSADKLNNDVDVSSLSVSSVSEINDNVFDNRVIPLALLVCVFVGFALMYLYQGSKTTAPTMRVFPFQLYSADNQSTLPSALHLSSNKNQ